MRADQQASGGNNENSLDFLWLVVILVVSVALIWYFGRNYIVSAVFWVKSYEIVAIDAVLKVWNKFVTWSSLPLPLSHAEKLSQWTSYINAKPTGVSFNNLKEASTVVGNYLRYPFCILLVVLGVSIYFTHLTMKFKNIYNMQRLRDKEKQNWPQITPVTQLDLVKENLDDGPWAMAMTPMQFAKQHQLVKTGIDQEGKGTVSIIIGAAYRVFALQLGALWNGPAALPIHVQALLAIFAARANRDRENADMLLKQISYSAQSGKLDFTGVKEVLKKNISNYKAAQKIFASHAYILSVMASMLELARTDGVLASAEFLWLKPLDRKLWYMLNSVGRRTAVPEIAGAYAHWIVEKKLERPLQVPMVDEAVKSLETALLEMIYDPETE